jgi:hypothetical protein
MKRPVATKRKKKPSKKQSAFRQSIEDGLSDIGVGLAIAAVKHFFPGITVKYHRFEPPQPPEPPKTIDLPDTDYKIID